MMDGLNGLSNNKKVSYFEYDFTKEGGAIGDITLRGAPIPSDAVVTDAMIRVNKQVLSLGAATAALSFKAANDVLSAVVLAGFTEDALIDGVPDGTVTHAILCTTDGGTDLVLTVATADLTDGRFTVAVEYY